MRAEFAFVVRLDSRVDIDGRHPIQAWFRVSVAVGMLKRSQQMTALMCLSRAFVYQRHIERERERESDVCVRETERERERDVCKRERERDVCKRERERVRAFVYHACESSSYLQSHLLLCPKSLGLEPYKVIDTYSAVDSLATGVSLMFSSLSRGHSVQYTARRLYLFAVGRPHGGNHVRLETL